MSVTHGRLIGIDFGKKRIGIAVSDERKMIASPLFTIDGFSSLKEAAEKLQEGLRAYPAIEAIVVGLPLHMSGEESDLSRLARQFGEVLEETFKLPIIFWDERLSSKQVERAMRESGMKRKKQAQFTDKLEETANSENYLDSQVCI